MKKTLHLGLALAVTLTLSSCYGPFNLTKKVYKWNGQVGQKWANEGAFLGLAILPVYMFSMLGDAVIFNSIEFWGGKNPVTAKATKSLSQGDQQTVMNFDPQTHTLRVDNFEKGHAVSTVTFEPGTNGHMVAHNAKGELLMSAVTEGDTIILTDASGKEVGRHNVSELQKPAAKTN